MVRCHDLVDCEASLGDWSYFVSMRASQIFDTDNAAWVERWTVPAARVPDEGGGWGYGTAAFRYRVTEALARLRLGDAGAAKRLLDLPRPPTAGAALQTDQVAGMLALHEGDVERGLSLLRKAAKAEAQLPMEFGPPDTVVPSHELLGAALLANGRAAAAVDAYRVALARTPGRLMAERGVSAALAARDGGAAD